MHLQAWALSTSDKGARSDVNCRYTDELLHHGSAPTSLHISTSMDDTQEQGLHCKHLQFHLPQGYHANGVTSVPVLVPSAMVGTIQQLPETLVFYALVEELIGWLEWIGPMHSLVRLYLNNNGQQLPRSYSSHWQDLHRGFTLIINRGRGIQSHFPGLGHFSGTFGVIEVARRGPPLVKFQGITWSP